MTEDQISKINRKSADEVVVSVPGGSFYHRRLVTAVEVAMNEEWWRGYYAGRKAERDSDAH